jgi:hypothetical protein
MSLITLIKDLLLRFLLSEKRRGFLAVVKNASPKTRPAVMEDMMVSVDFVKSSLVHRTSGIQPLHVETSTVIRHKRFFKDVLALS